jgi:hypothetical protein
LDVRLWLSNADEGPEETTTRRTVKHAAAVAKAATRINQRILVAIELAERSNTAPIESGISNAEIYPHMPRIKNLTGFVTTPYLDETRRRADSSDGSQRNHHGLRFPIPIPQAGPLAGPGTDRV